MELGRPEPCLDLLAIQSTLVQHSALFGPVSCNRQVGVLHFLGLSD